MMKQHRTLRHSAELDPGRTLLAQLLIEHARRNPAPKKGRRKLWGPRRTTIGALSASTALAISRAKSRAGIAARCDTTARARMRCARGANMESAGRTRWFVAGFLYIGGDRTRLDRDYFNAERRQLQAHRIGDGMKSGLARAIGTGKWRRKDSGNAANVNDASPALGQHEKREEGTGDLYRRNHVCVELMAKLLSGDVGDCTV